MRSTWNGFNRNMPDKGWIIIFISVAVLLFLSSIYFYDGDVTMPIVVDGLACVFLYGAYSTYKGMKEKKAKAERLKEEKARKEAEERRKAKDDSVCGTPIVNEWFDEGEESEE